MAATTVLLGVPAAPALADVSGELENGTITPAANAKKAAESAASGGFAVEMWDASSVELKVTNSTATTAFKIRARQEICGPAAAQMAVKVDGVNAGTFTIANTTYADVAVTGNWAAGQHTVRAEFVNAYHQADCVARELWLDKVTAVSATTYYVDQNAAAGGNGLSQATAWKTIATVNAAALKAGDTVLFRAGQTWTNANLQAKTSKVTYGSYGTGTAPIFDGGGLAHPIEILKGADFVTVQDVTVRNGGDDDKVGLAVKGTDALVRRITATGNAIGVQAYDDAHRLRVTASTLSNNTTVINPDGLGKADGSEDDYGASGAAVLAATDVQIDHNTISGNYGPSADFGYDGSAVEVFGAVNLKVDHNTATNNQTFSELGNTATSNASFYDNVIVTTASFPIAEALGINVQGTGSFGPVRGTRVSNNTFVLDSSGAGALIVGSGADATFQNNIVQADAAGYTNEQKINEGHNVYYKTTYLTGMLSTANTSTAGGIAPTSTVANPLFVSATDYHLQTGSPAKNRGADAYGVTTDRDDQPRVFGSSVDAGAYERQSA